MELLGALVILPALTAGLVMIYHPGGAFDVWRHHAVMLVYLTSRSRQCPPWAWSTALWTSISECPAVPSCDFPEPEQTVADKWWWQSSTPTNDLSLPIVTSMQHFTHHRLRQHTAGWNVTLKWQLEVPSYLLVCLIVQNNHPTINSSMPNNFHA